MNARRSWTRSWRRLCSILWVAVWAGGLSADAQWTLLDTPQPSVIHGVTVNGEMVYLSGTKTSFSANGGANWTVVTPTFQGLSAYCYDVEFASDDTVFWGGSSFLADSRLIYRKIGSDPWQLVLSGSSNQFLRIFDIDMVNAQTGYACGLHGGLLRTTDGGDNWTSVASGTAEDIWRVSFWTATIGLITTGDMVYRTDDGGSSWTPLGFDAVTFELNPDGSGHAFGSGSVHRTSNYGATWTEVPNACASIRDGHARGSDTLYVCSWDGGVFVTYDAGDHWTSLLDTYGIPLMYLAFSGDSVAYAANEDGTWKSDEVDGPTDVVAEVNVHTFPLCGHTMVRLEDLSTFCWNNTWLFMGEPVGTGALLEVDTFTNASTYVEFALVVDNGAQQDTVYWQDTVHVQQPITANAGSDLVLCANDTAQLSATGGVIYQWDPPYGLSDANVAAPLVWLTPETYVLTATDALCTSTDTVQVTRPEGPPMTDWNLFYEHYALYPMDIFAFSSDIVGAHHASDAYSFTFDGGGTVTQRTDLPFGASMQMLDPFLGFRERSLDNTLWKTTDAWGTYQLVFPDTSGGQLEDFEFVNEQVGYMFYEGEVMRTDDGGITWASLLDVWPVAQQGSFHCVSADTCLLYCPTLQQMHVTHDGGDTWFSPELPPLGENSDIVDNGHGVLFMAGRTNDLMHMGRSFDGGHTWDWRPIELDTYVLGLRIHFTSDSVGFVWADERAPLTTDDLGQCWKLIEGGWSAGTVKIERMATAPSGTLFRSGDLYDQPEHLVHIERHGAAEQLPASLAIGLSGSSICAGEQVPVWNASEGYAGYSWYLDGAFLTNLPQPDWPDLSPGEHVIGLTGTNGPDTDSTTAVLLVHPVPTLTPETPWVLGPACDGLDSLAFATSGAQPGEHYVWHTNGPDWTGYWSQDDTAYVHLFTSTDTAFVSVAIANGQGCAGPSSDVIGTPLIPSIGTPYMITGEFDVCISEGAETTSTFNCWTTFGALGYVWAIDCPAAGTITSDGTEATVVWNGTSSGVECMLSVYAYNVCGDSAPRTGILDLQQEPVLALQPQDITLAHGEPLAMGFATTGTASNIQWYHNGVAISGANEQDLLLASCTFSDSGSYWASMTLLQCDGLATIWTDTAYVTIVPAQLIAAISAPDTACLPALVQFVDASSGVAISWNWQFPGGDPDQSTEQDPLVTYLVPGTYTAQLVVSDGSSTSGPASMDVVVMSCTGIMENQRTAFSLYPNPAHDVLYIAGPGELVLSLVDMTGRTVRTVHAPQGISEVPIADLGAGCYLALIASDKGTLRSRLEISKW